MKSELLESSEFIPIEVKITFETKKEFQAFYSLMGYTTAKDKYGIVYKTIPDKNNGSLRENDFLSMEILCDNIIPFNKP